MFNICTFKLKHIPNKHFSVPRHSSACIVVPRCVLWPEDNVNQAGVDVTDVEEIEAWAESWRVIQPVGWIRLKVPRTASSVIIRLVSEG